MSLSSTDLPLDFGGRNNECVDGLPPCPEFDVSTMQARKQLKKFRWMGRNLLGYEAVARSSICSLMQRWSTKGLASMNDFLDQRISKELRESFFRELQNLESPYSCQRLQIVFSFSIPTDTAIDVIVNLKCSVVSAGAGLGYWEWLCQERGVDLVAFDANDSYPAPMRYMKIHTGSSQDLAMGGRWAAPRWSALFMSWPDAGEHSTFGFDCVSNFQGDVVSGKPPHRCADRNVHIPKSIRAVYVLHCLLAEVARDHEDSIGSCADDCDSFHCLFNVDLPGTAVRALH
eukprot:m.422233 g.422233  ORF g.422233 m.422233 type:complete len:287 (+) comp21328_c0_seq4:286-1146(+)